MNLFVNVGIGETILCMAFFIILILISISDLYKKKIPDLFCGIIFVIGVISIFFIKDIRIVDRLLGVFVISVPMLIVSSVFQRSFGGGDIKLMASGGMFLGVKLVTVSAILGLLIAGIYIVIAKISKNKDIGRGIALAPCISIGMITSCILGIQIWNILL